MRKMMIVVAGVLGGSLVFAQTHTAGPAGPAAGKRAVMSDQAKIRQAMSAAPADLARSAAIMDWPASPGGPMRQLRAGTNGWTCLPSTPTAYEAAAGEDPMCVDKAFMAWAEAWMTKKDPPPSTVVGISYMLRGDRGASNTDPLATGPAPDNQWVVSPSHIMILVPDLAGLDGLPTDPRSGGPFVMWKGTKYAHLMVPTASMPGPVAAAARQPAATATRTAGQAR